MEQVGAQLSLDRGDGNTKRVPMSELGAQISIRGTLDGYGRVATFSRHGEQHAPSLYSILKASRSVAISGHLGAPGAIRSTALFLGAIRQGTYTPFPSVADIECQDYSARFANIPFEYYWPQKQPATRLEILIDVILQYGIPCDTAALDLGNDDGGYIMKGINEAGTNHLLDWIRDFLLPIGRRFYFRPDGQMEVFYIDETRAADKTLTAGDIITMRIVPPAVNDPNAVSVSAFLFSYVGPSGTRKTIRIEQGPDETFTPNYAASRQFHITGVVTGVAAGGSVTGPRWKTVTTTSWDGGSPITQLIEEYGYYSPLACRNQQDAAGAVTWNHSFDVYFYADGTDRVESQFQFRVIRRTLNVFTYDGTTKRLLSDASNVTRYCAIEMPLAFIDAAGVTNYQAGFQTFGGNSWWAGREFIDVDNQDNGGTFWGSGVCRDVEIVNTAYEARARESGTTQDVERSYSPNGDNELVSEVWTVYLWAQNTYPVLNTAPPAPPTTSWKFGPQPSYGNVPVYCSRSTNGSFGFRAMINVGSGSVTRARYDATTYHQTASYSITSATLESSQRVLLLYGTFISTFYIYLGTISLSLPIPVNEYKTAVQVPQTHNREATDDVRIALAGETFTIFLSNDNCETTNELETVGREELRFRSAQRVEIKIPLELDIDEGTILNFPREDFAGQMAKGVVWNWEATIGDRGDAVKKLTVCVFPANLQQEAA